MIGYMPNRSIEYGNNFLNIIITFPTYITYFDTCNFLWIKSFEKKKIDELRCKDTNKKECNYASKDQAKYQTGDCIEVGRAIIPFKEQLDDQNQEKNYSDYLKNEWKYA